MNAIVYLELMNVVHRDVKPANILLFERDQAFRSIYTKLANLGSASQEQSLHTCGGTSVYAAPVNQDGAARYLVLLRSIKV